MLLLLNVLLMNRYIGYELVDYDEVLLLFVESCKSWKIDELLMI